MATRAAISEPAFFRPAQPIRRDQVEDLLKLQKAAKRISSILDLDQLIDHLVNDIAHSFGCTEANIYLRSADCEEMILAGVHGCSTSSKGKCLKIGKEGMVGYVASTAQMRYAPDVSKDPYYIPCEPDIQSEVAIPLEIDGRIIGVFTASHCDLDAFPPEQLRMLQSLCTHVAVAVQNAQLFERERREKEKMTREAEEARAIQEALFPKSSPYVEGFRIMGLSVSAGAVGGDWYDFIALDEHRWGLVLADVSGKGTAAALLMSATRGMLRSLAEACCTPGEVMTKLNRLLLEGFPNGRFVTMVYALLDPLTRTLNFVNAGHLPPLLVDGSGARFLESEAGMPLGLGFGAYSEKTITLQEGSRLVLYSDGITEAANPEGEEYGLRRLEEHVRGTKATAKSILDDVRSFANGAGIHDDATVIVIQAEP